MNPWDWIKLLDAANSRVAKIRLGEKITNVRAQGHGYLSQYIITPITPMDFDYTVYMISLDDTHEGCPVEEIYPGHLSREECAGLYEELYKIKYGIEE